MDVKDLRTGTALSERSNDDSKYSQGGVALQCKRNKSYQNIGSNPLAKTEQAPVRPCAVIGPDRVVPPLASNDAYLKKVTLDPWPSPENAYRRPSEYIQKGCINQNPLRNISPRQTFQENMQRIMVPPTYNAVRLDDPNFNCIQERSVGISKNNKPNMGPEAKYCDVPYAMNTLTNETKNIRDNEMCVPSVNSPMVRTAPPGWTPNNVNVHTPRSYGPQEIYQYQQYPSCAGQRPTVIPMSRHHRTIQEDSGYVYPDHYYQDPSIRFKPYAHVKDRYPHPRYEYIGNYPSPFHPPPPLQPHKYDIPKLGQTPPYPTYPHLKYLDNRVPEHSLEGYQRTANQQSHYNIQFRNQVIHPAYPTPVAGNISQNKLHPYPPDASVKPITLNKLPYENNSKMYVDYESARTKTYPATDNYFVNEMARVHPIKNQMTMPNYPCIGMHPTPTQQHYRKDNSSIKSYEYMTHFRNFEPPMNSRNMMRHPPQFSPNTLAISPTDSNTSNDTTPTQGISQEDCGYVSQSSTASVRSVDSTMYRLPHEYYKRYDYRYGPIVGSAPTLSKCEPNPNGNSKNSKQKQIDVRQFLQMWNEGEDDNSENNNSKEIVIPKVSSGTHNFQKQHANSHDQLYVLGLVNVPSEELGKYEHIQKISKLPENIKGYNSLELLSQFEEAIESSTTNGFKSVSKEYPIPSKNNTQKSLLEALPRPVSPLDVEAKISQSVIHKEVGCNFEIRPCSPKILNVEIAAPAQNILGERVIEKVSNPLSKMSKSPVSIKPEEKSNCNKRQDNSNSFSINNNPSCKMIGSPYTTNNMDSCKTNYSLQDLEINSGVCLASLPRLDNEIELNFPEVNQQFINANKKDTNPLKNVSPQSIVETESTVSDSGSLTKKNIEKTDDVLTSDEPDKTFTKLSKYRKLKSNPTDSSLKNQSTQVRTDSVIIKNPENIKNIEDKLLENSFNLPINLTSESATNHDSCIELLDKKDDDIDVALDFSLNKTSNGLPIINTEKKEFKESLAIKLSNITCESTSLTESSESRKNNIKCSEKLLIQDKPKDVDIFAECVEYETNLKSISDVSKEAEAIINEDISKSVVVKNYSILSILNTACSENLIPENNPLAHEHPNIDCNDDTTKDMDQDYAYICTEKQTLDKKCDFHGDTVLPIENKVFNENKSKQVVENDHSKLKLLPTEVVTKHEEILRNIQCSHRSESVSESETNNLISELVIPSQNEDILGNDEISAKLEKLFGVTNDTTLPVMKNDSFDVSLSIPNKTFCSHQSKELHSPWIQKLLIHSEGFCSLDDNVTTKKKSLKSILKCDEHVINPEQTNSCMIDGIELRNTDVNHSNDTTNISCGYSIPDKDLTEITSEDLVSDADYEVVSESKEIRYHPNLIVGIGNSTSNSECILKSENTGNSTFEAQQSKCYPNLIKKYENDVTESNIEMVLGDNDLFLKERDSTNIEIEGKPLKCNLNQLKQNEITQSKLQNSVNNDETWTQDIKDIEKADSEDWQSKCHLDELQQNINEVTESELQSTLINNECLPKENHIDEKQFKSVNQLQQNELIESEIQNNECWLKKKDIEKVELEDRESKCHLDRLYQNVNEVMKLELKNNFNNNEGLSTEKDITINAAFENKQSKCYLNKVQQNEVTQSESQNSINNDGCKDINEIEKVEIGDRQSKWHLDKLQQNVNEVTKSRSQHSVSNDAYLPKTRNIDKVEFKSELSKCHQNQLQENINKVTESELPNTLSNNECLSTGNNISANAEFENIQFKCNLNKLQQNINEVTETNSQKVNHERNSDLGIKQKTTDTFCLNKLPEISDSGKIAPVLEVKTSDDGINECEVSKLKNFQGLLNCSNTNILPKYEKVPNNKIDLISSRRNTPEGNASEIVESGKDIDEFVIYDEISIAEEKVSELDGNNKNTHKSVNIKHTDLNIPSFENVLNPVALNNKVNQAEDNLNVGNRNVLVIRDNDMVTDLGIFDNSDTVCRLDNAVKENISGSKIENISNNYSDFLHHNEENQNEEILKASRDLLFSDVNDTVTDLNDEKILSGASIGLEIQDTFSNVSDIFNDHQNIKVDSLKEHNTDTDDIALNLFEGCNNENSNQAITYNQIQLKQNASITENKIRSHECSTNDYSAKRRLPLKRSFSDSALNSYNNRDATFKDNIETTPLTWPSKRQRIYELENPEQNLIAENLCRFIQNNRRNSVSSYYNDENVSFCILIDNNCILTEENEEEKICFAELTEDCIAEINTTNEEQNAGETISPVANELQFSQSVILSYQNEKAIQESWLDDVACVETVVTDDVEDIDIGAHASPRGIEDAAYHESENSNCAVSEDTDEVTCIDEENILNVAEIIETYKNDVDDEEFDCKSQACEPVLTFRTPHMDINKILSRRDSKYCSSLFGDEALEKILSESNSRECSLSPRKDYNESIYFPDDTNSEVPEDKENIFVDNVSPKTDENCIQHNVKRTSDENSYEEINQIETLSTITHDDSMHSCESSIDNLFSYKQKNEDYITSSSPEVSSTTSEEKSSSILLKITNYNGSRVSEINEISHNKPRCKFTEKKEYSNSRAGYPNGPLITKAAQKYIPPLKESIRDLKVKLSLPQQRLIKLKQLKLSRSGPKVNKQSNVIPKIPKKPKPNFEDVLKSIDEIQIKMHKEKNKKTKHVIPKVVIKKNVNGSHYTSSSNKDTFNPDLTGRKWQPWVFLEKNHFIDKMALRNNTKAIFNHRKNMYVLAEKFKKYKSVSSTKFVISQPKSGASSKGQLKYTIRLKHAY